MKLDYLPVIQNERYPDCAFIPLPRELWESAGACSCDHCKGSEGFYDTLSIKIGQPTCQVHNPELHARTHFLHSSSNASQHAPRLLRLHAALKDCTDAGILDTLAEEYAHPIIMNDFCDAVSAACGKS